MRKYGSIFTYLSTQNTYNVVRPLWTVPVWLGYTMGYDWIYGLINSITFLFRPKCFRHRKCWNWWIVCFPFYFSISGIFARKTLFWPVVLVKSFSNVVQFRRRSKTWTTLRAQTMFVKTFDFLLFFLSFFHNCNKWICLLCRTTSFVHSHRDQKKKKKENNKKVHHHQQQHIVYMKMWSVAK